MRAVFLKTMLLAGLAVTACSFAARAEIIDRIAVSVGNQVITEAQIDEQIHVTAFLNHEKPKLSPAEKKNAAERLIEQTLIKREIDFTRYPVPEMSEADQSLKNIRSQYRDEAEFQKALHEDGIDEQELRTQLWWQLTVLRFIDYRFRPGVQISDADIKEYYDQQVAGWRERGVQEIPSLEDSRGKIEEILTGQRIDQALDRWLGDTRTQVEIRYRPGGFE